MRRDLGDAVADVLMAAAVLTALVALMWSGWRDSTARTACEDSGGRVEQYDCSTQMACSTYDANGSCLPTEHP